MTPCGVHGCPKPAQGRFTRSETVRGVERVVEQVDPLCTLHAQLASARAHATLARTGACGDDREQTWRAAWARVKLAGLPLPPVKALPIYARLDTDRPSGRRLGGMLP